MPNSRLRSLLLCLLLLVLPAVALAHPMGNFSVNHYSKITLEAHDVRIQFIIDLAEIPTYQELQQGGIQALASDPAVLRYAHARGEQFAHELSLTLAGKAVPLKLRSSSVIFPPGAGGLPTMKMGFIFEGAYPQQASPADLALNYQDDTYRGHTGWKEIIASAGAGHVLKTTVPSTDRSHGLTDYPTDLLSNPPQDLEASLVVDLPVAAPPVPLPVHAAPTPPIGIAVHKPASTELQPPPTPAAPVLAPASAPLELQANQQKTPRNRFTELISAQSLSPWFFFTAIFIAMGLGALHALEPGHGKTIVAAYLVGSRGTARHAALLGLIVTLAHTAGVFALGAITLYASRYIVPEQLYPWLGVLSGLTIVGLGLYIVLQRATGNVAEHSHLDGEAHGLWPFRKSQTDRAAEPQDPHVSLRQLLTLGITGGIIPCPAALIVLLSAFALHRIALGLLLIVAFSFGLAAVLILFGMAMVYARRFMTHLQIDGPLTTRWLPIASAAFMTLLGCAITIQAVMAMPLHLSHLSLSQLSLDQFSLSRLGPVLFVSGLGLLLGMRHSTDADHIVALSTIISKQRSIKSAALIGSLWGVGHTVTIFAVGSLIILFGVQIPPRIGLSMEFSVAVMLIVLGLLNLTGLMQRINARFSGNTINRSSAAGPVPFRDSIERFGLYQCIRPVVIGLVHGLAGSAAVALLVLSTIHNPLWATVYLLIFGIGTILGMMIMTTAIAVPLTYSGKRFTKLSGYLAMTSGMVSLCFGSFLVYQLGFLGGLFTRHPHWTPQ